MRMKIIRMEVKLLIFISITFVLSACETFEEGGDIEIITSKYQLGETCYLDYVKTRLRTNYIAKIGVSGGCPIISSRKYLNAIKKYIKSQELDKIKGKIWIDVYKRIDNPKEFYYGIIKLFPNKKVCIEESVIIIEY